MLRLKDPFPQIGGDTSVPTCTAVGRDVPWKEIYFFFQLEVVFSVFDLRRNIDIAVLSINDCRFY